MSVVIGEMILNPWVSGDGLNVMVLSLKHSIYAEI